MDLYNLPLERRSLSAVRSQLDQTSLDGIGARLERWTHGKEFGWVFDNEADTLRLDARLMGFDDEAAAHHGHRDGFPIVVADTPAYRQFGNAVVPRVVTEVGRGIVSVLHWQLDRTGNGCLLKGRTLTPEGAGRPASRRADPTAAASR